MTKRIAIASQKGGVGKTTVSLNLAVALAELGKSVMLVDLDPQGGVTLSLAQPDLALEGLAEVLVGAASPLDAVTRTKLDGLSLLPRGRLDPVDICTYELALQDKVRLDMVLQAVEGDIDVTILDLPSGLGMITRSALSISDFVLVPFQSEPLAMRSVQQLLRVVEHVRMTENAKLKLLGILPTMVDKANESSWSTLGDIVTGFSGVLEAAIPRAAVFIEASLKGLPVAFMGGPESAESSRFTMLAQEINGIIQKQSGMEQADEQRAERQLL